jgi:hypothetical protein
MIRSAYWPDAIDTHLDFKGTVEQFIEWAFPIMRQMDQSQHIVANVLMTVRGDKADVESYFYGYHRLVIDGQARDVIGCGRYLDKFEKRNDEWRVAQRLVMTDWFRESPDSADWSKGLMGQRLDIGKRKPEDPSYSLLNIE